MATLTFLLAYLLVVVALFSVALFVGLTKSLPDRPHRTELTINPSYEHVNSTSLSLPISPALTIVTVLFPLAAAVNTFFYPRLASSGSRPHRVLAHALQVAQGILTTVVATLLFSTIIPSTARDCLLSTIWQRFFSSHDAESIRRIQDALNCCGLNTVRDRAWPFPNQHGSQQCAETYGRNTACIQPWRNALQRNSGISFGIVLVIGLIQIAGWFPWGNPATRTPTTRGMVYYGTADGEEAERARLLPAVAGAIEDGETTSDPNNPPNEDVPADNRTDTAAGNGRVVERPNGNPWASD